MSCRRASRTRRSPRAVGSQWAIPSRRAQCAAHASPAPVALACWALLLLALAVLPSCGGGGGTIVPPPPPPPPPPTPQPLGISTTALPDLVLGASSGFNPSATGGTPPLSWSVAAGNLPPGMTLSSAGFLSGRPASIGSYPVTLEVRDAASATVSRSFTMNVYFPLLYVFPRTLPFAVPGRPFLAAIQARNGKPPYTNWVMRQLPSGFPLPPGITLDSSGVLSGTLSLSASERLYEFIVDVADSSSPPQNLTGVFNFGVANQLTVMSGEMPTAFLGELYRATIWAAGGTEPLTWGLAPGSNLPAGLALDPATGEVSGIPSSIGFHSFGVRVTDSSSPPQTVTNSFSITLNVTAPLVFQGSSTLPDGVVTQSASANFNYGGGHQPYSLRIVSGSLPSGVNLRAIYSFPSVFYDLEGILNGAGTYSFTLEVTDAGSPPCTASKSFTWRINPLLVANLQPTLPEALEGSPYNYVYQVTGGLPPYTWTGGCTTSTFQCSSAGVAFDTATASYFGTPNLPGLIPFNIGLSDSGNPPQQRFSFVTLPVIGLLRPTSTLPPIVVGQPVQIALGTAGGVPPFNWSLVSGSLPAGLSFSSPAGLITGAPTQVESQPITVGLQDSGITYRQSIQQSLTLQIVNAQGRNDSIATATPVSNGLYRASLSPSDSSGVFAPDTDYYRITANTGMTVTIETFAERLNPSAPTDTVIEILDSAGVRLAACNPSGGGNFISPCLSDDDPWIGTTDSKLFLRVPGTPGSGTPVTFYVRVLDWSGDARPDFRYEISITGVN